MAKAEKKWAKEVAWCLAEGLQPEEIQGVKEEGNVKNEGPEVEVDPEDKAQAEEPKGSRDVVLVAEGVQRCRASEWLAGGGGDGGGQGSQGSVRLALQPSRPGWATAPGAR